MPHDNKPTNKGHKKKRVLWSTEAESFLIELWEEKMSDFRSTRKNSHVYEEMAMELELRGVAFSSAPNKARTLSLESRFNYTTIALSPDGSLLIAVNEKGQAQLISMVSCTVIHQHKFQSSVQCVVFSPNGCHFAVAKGNLVFVFKTPGELTGEYNPFVLERHYLGGYDDITWLDWLSDSRFLAVGCRDNTTKVIGVRFVKNFRTYILGGHTEPIVACFFEQNSLHLNTVSRNGQLCIWECSLGLSELLEVSRGTRASNLPAKKKKLTSGRKILYITKNIV